MRMTKKKPESEADNTGATQTENAKPESGARSPAAKKRVSREKKMDAAQVHEQIAAIVRAEAEEIAQALIERAIHGDPAAARYLFEFARIFPTADETNAEAKEEDSLAKTLMHRLNLPEEPIQIDEDEDGKAAIAKNQADAGAGPDSESGVLIEVIKR
jgi:hypothetical protein